MLYKNILFLELLTKFVPIDFFDNAILWSYRDIGRCETFKIAGIKKCTPF